MYKEYLFSRKTRSPRALSVEAESPRPVTLPVLMKLRLGNETAIQDVLTPQHDAKAARVAKQDYFGATKAPRLNDNRTFQDAWYTR